jgi:hypothetical protein
MSLATGKPSKRPAKLFGIRENTTLSRACPPQDKSVAAKITSSRERNVRTLRGTFGCGRGVFGCEGLRGWGCFWGSGVGKSENVLEAVDWELLEAGDGVRCIVERLEEPVDSRKFQSGGGAIGEGGEFDVAIALHGLFQTAQQDMDAGAVEVLEFRAIDYDARPVGVQASFQFAKKCPAL